MRIWCPCFSVLLLLISSCQQTNEVIEGRFPPFAIDLQTGFQHDTVRVSVDNKSVFEDTVTTASLIGLAQRIPVRIGAGIHTVKVSILNQHVNGDVTFLALDTLVVAVNYTRPTSELHFMLYRFWVMYI